MKKLIIRQVNVWSNKYDISLQSGFGVESEIYVLTHEQSSSGEEKNPSLICYGKFMHIGYDFRMLLNTAVKQH